MHGPTTSGIDKLRATLDEHGWQHYCCDQPMAKKRRFTTLTPLQRAILTFYVCTRCGDVRNLSARLETY